MAKMPPEMVGKDKELYLAALKNTIPMYSETGKMDPKGADAVLAVFSESSPEVAKANVDVSQDLHQQVRRAGQEDDGDECEIIRSGGMTPPVIHRVTTLDLQFRALAVAVRGAAARRNRCAFRGQAAREADLERPHPDGARSGFRGECFPASYFETDFASFLAWRDWGFPDAGVFNGFGVGALRAADGAFVLGEMAHHTSNAGRNYSRRERPISTTSAATRSTSPAASPVRSRRKPDLRLRIITPMRTGIAWSRRARSR